MVPRRLYRGFVSAAVFGLLAAVGVSTASASCGDYVIVGNPQGELPFFARLLGMDRMMAMPHADHPEPPCHGPLCSSAPISDPVPPVSITFTPRESACGLTAQLFQDHGLRLTTAEMPRVHPIIWPSSIFRPPCAVRA